MVADPCSCWNDHGRDSGLRFLFNFPLGQLVDSDNFRAGRISDADRPIEMTALFGPIREMISISLFQPHRLHDPVDFFFQFRFSGEVSREIDLQQLTFIGSG
jgi:hypothetical protein